MSVTIRSTLFISQRSPRTLTRAYTAPASVTIVDGVAAPRTLIRNLHHSWNLSEGGELLTHLSMDARGSFANALHVSQVDTEKIALPEKSEYYNIKWSAPCS